jgi:hypothetical protein
MTGRDSRPSFPGGQSNVAAAATEGTIPFDMPFTERDGALIVDVHARGAGEGSRLPLTRSEFLYRPCQLQQFSNDWFTRSFAMLVIMSPALYCADDCGGQFLYPRRRNVAGAGR